MNSSAICRAQASASFAATALSIAWKAVMMSCSTTFLARYGRVLHGLSQAGATADSMDPARTGISRAIVLSW